MMTLTFGRVILLCCAVAAIIYLAFEGQRFYAKYTLCSSDYTVHDDFAQESVCTGNKSAIYAARKLTDCPKAEQHIIEETPLQCALRNWWLTSWIWKIILMGISLYERATNSIMLSLVIPGAFIALAYFYIQDKGITTRHALTLENQNQPIEIMERMVSKLQHPQPNQSETKLLNPQGKVLKRARSSSRLVSQPQPQPEDF
jgi:hypothetical protein